MKALNAPREDVVRTVVSFESPSPFDAYCRRQRLNDLSETSPRESALLSGMVANVKKLSFFSVRAVRR
jgi:hypothetical protein